MMSGDVAGVYSGVCQLFELFLLACFRAFSDVAVAAIVGETAPSAAARAAALSEDVDEVPSPPPPSLRCAYLAGKRLPFPPD